MKDGKLHWKNRDLTGQLFGNLRAVRPYGSNGKKMSWVFLCLCGKEVVRKGTDVTKEVRRGGRPNCGCLTKQLQSAPKTHGLTKHPLYAVWRSMMDRCRLPSHQAWENYGARGIRVCECWKTFELFWADVSGDYQPGLTLDRRDNNEGYCPANCRWVDSKLQARNKRNNVFIPTPWGEITVAEASERSGIGTTTLHYRISAGWPNDKLFIAPDVRNRQMSTTF